VKRGECTGKGKNLTEHKGSVNEKEVRGVEKRSTQSERWRVVTTAAALSSPVSHSNTSLSSLLQYFLHLFLLLSLVIPFFPAIFPFWKSKASSAQTKDFYFHSFFFSLF
jgi:uncharacterized membrane protein